MIQGPGSVECNVQTGGEAPVHVLVDNIVSLAADETGFEEVVADLRDAGIGCAVICVCNGSI